MHETRNSYHTLMNASHLLDEGLALAADAVLSGGVDELPEAVSIHLSACQPCRLAVMELVQAEEMVQSGQACERPDLHEDGTNEPVIPLLRKPGRFMKVAAVILLLLASLMGPILNDSMGHLSRFSTYLVSWYYPDPHDPFKADPLMESITNMVFRGSHVTVMSPVTGNTMAAGKPILFQWINLKPQPLTLSLQDNKGKLIARVEVYTDSFRVDSLSSGLYYWKLEWEKELIYLGSFVVDKP